MQPTDRLPATFDRRTALKFGGLGVATLALPGLAACGSSGTTVGAQQAGPLGTAGPNIFQDLDPHIASAIGTIALTDQIFEGLYRTNLIDPTRIDAALAAGDPEPAGERRYRVTLRDGAVFHDGSPVTADDIVFSFERIRDPELASLYARFLEFIESVRDVDDRTVELRLAYDMPLLTARLALVRIMSRSVVERATKRELATAPVGSGPFRLQDTQLSRMATLRKFDRYSGASVPSMQEVSYQVVPNDSARVSGVQSGRFDLIYDPPYQNLEGLDAGRTKLVSTPSFAHTNLYLNCGKAPFDDVRVRQALYCAIDRDAITETVYAGRAESADAPLPSSHPDYVEPPDAYEHDPERARRLLAEAGAESLNIDLMVANLGYVAPQATLLESQLREVGIRVSVELGETEALVQKVLDGSYQAWLTIGDASVVGAYDGEFLLRWLYYGFIATDFMYWRTPEQKQVERLLDDALRAEDEDGRRAALTEVQEILAREVPVLTMHFREQPVAYGSGLELEASPVLGVDLRTVERV